MPTFVSNEKEMVFHQMSMYDEKKKKAFLCASPDVNSQRHGPTKCNFKESFIGKLPPETEQEQEQTNKMHRKQQSETYFCARRPH